VSPAGKRIAREEATVKRIHAAAIDAVKAIKQAAEKGGEHFANVDGRSTAWSLVGETPRFIEQHRQSKLSESREFYADEPEGLEQDQHVENVIHDLALELRTILAEAGKGADDPEATAERVQELADAEEEGVGAIEKSRQHELSVTRAARKMRAILDALLNSIPMDDRSDIEERLQDLVFGE
jgi:hypothetical protein